ncbi:Flp family type IVb pilin [Castellaniella sp.]|uniref:Flp family type IVb pilin n=1 Tax=Castellaniella sp. TaxID=1955812 RepID=UPI00356AF402
MFATVCRKVYVAAQNLKDDARGVSALEYAILAGLIVAAVVVGVGLFSNALENAFTILAGNVTTAVGGGS